jgi:hypothetical protein
MCWPRGYAVTNVVDVFQSGWALVTKPSQRDVAGAYEARIVIEIVAQTVERSLAWCARSQKTVREKHAVPVFNKEDVCKSDLNGR